MENQKEVHRAKDLIVRERPETTATADDKCLTHRHILALSIRAAARGNPIARLQAALVRRTRATSGADWLPRRGRISEMTTLFNRFVRDESGQDLIEYGLLVGIITAVTVGTVILIAPIVTGYYTTLCAAIGC